MKFTTATLAATSVILISASPVTTRQADAQIADNDVFSILTIRSGSDFQYSNFQAAQRSLYINTPSQNATCSTPDINYASFYLSNGSLYLATPPGAPAQQFYVDRSGMGQGVVQYSTGSGTIGRNQERGPFSLDDSNNLVFGPNKDIGFQACPGARQGGYSVWLQGQQNPGFNQGCLPFVATALKEDCPIECTYTT